MGYYTDLRLKQYKTTLLLKVNSLRKGRSNFQGNMHYISSVCICAVYSHFQNSAFLSVYLMTEIEADLLSVQPEDF